MLLIIAIIPETPRWLAGHDRNDECLQVLRRMHQSKMTDEDIKAEYDLIINTVALETAAGAASWKDLFRSDGKLLARKRSRHIADSFGRSGSYSETLPHRLRYPDLPAAGWHQRLDL